MRWIVAICGLIGLLALQDTGSQVHKQDTVVIVGRFAIDLDDGRVGIDDSNAAVEKNGQSPVLILDGEYESPLPFHGSFKGSDFWFEDGKQQFLRPQNGAQFTRGIMMKPDQAACVAATYTKNALRIDKLSGKKYFCIRTNEGRYASILINGYNPKTTELSLSFTTWEKNTR